MSKKKIIISAINIRQGGTLSVLNDCLTFLENEISQEYEIIALVHKKSMFDSYKQIKFIEFPNSMNSYLRRCFYEYIFFNRLSKRLKPYLWLSLHDMTPNVKADIRAVYCHNPCMFYRLNGIKEFFVDKTFFIFCLFYRFLYEFNIKSNDYVIVQQTWIKNEFIKTFSLEPKKIIVSYPNILVSKKSQRKKCRKSQKYTLFYASFPACFKNFEIIGEAAALLKKKNIENINFVVTIDGSENKYSKSVYEKYKHLDNIEFIGLQSRESVFELYKSSDCFLFPSKLETWGMPISEAKAFNMPIILSDLPYAHETLGKYEKANFFNPSSAEDLVNKILDTQKDIFSVNNDVITELPFANSWKGLFNILLGRNNVL